MKVLHNNSPAFDPDLLPQPVVAIDLAIGENGEELPLHQHRKGQLVVALHGGVICEAANGLWMVPPQCAVWIPGGTPHSNHTTLNSHLCFLFVEPERVKLPNQCCTLSLTPLLRELIQRIALLPKDYTADSVSGRLAIVLLEELAQMQVEELHLPISNDARLRKIAKMLTKHPADRSTVDEWGARVAMSERSLSRLVQRETGMTFGRWRQQLHIIIALQQLAAGERVQRVAENLGYESVNAFITMFKKMLGKPPARYFSERDGH